ncbi:MAG: tetratricopeptide repeat protein [Lysobacterales bacterium]
MTSTLEQAIREHQQGQLDRAERVYRTLLTEQPDNPDALHFLGLLLHQQGDSASAIELIQRSLRTCPEYADAHKNLGTIHQASGQSSAAEKCYRRALEIDGEDADAWDRLCVALKNQRRFAEAIAAGQRSVALRGGIAASWFNLGNALARAAHLEQAVEAYARALELERTLVPAHVELCHVLYRMDRAGKGSAATAQRRIEAYRAWLEADPENPIARFMLAACEGGAPAARAPDDFVRELFDDFADSFEQKLSALDYRVPGLIEERLAGNAGLGGRELDVLDAGCGTGLCGPFLRTVAGRLTGVDLSGQMLQRAARRGVYDRLVEAELSGFLQNEASRFELIVAADTLVYFGDLGKITRAAAAALTPAGLLLFTVERHSDATQSGVRLNSSGRYSHSRAHVEGCLRAAGLNLVHCEEVVLRQESGQPVAGILIEASKPGDMENSLA